MWNGRIWQVTGEGASASSGDEAPLSFVAEAALARLILRERRYREDCLGAHYFADPVWDIMLDLFAAQVRGEQVATSSLVIAASVPQSTALRHIRRLVKEGVIIAWADPNDGRRTFVRLSDDRHARVGALMRQWRDKLENYAS
jgi:DNA-binding transcriptional ArsR family regulator